MAAHQVPLSLGFSRQEYWSGLPFPSPRIFKIISNTSIIEIGFFFVFFFCFFFLENHLCYSEYKKLYILLDFSGGIVDKNLSANAGDPSLIPGPGRFYMLWNS